MKLEYGSLEPMPQGKRLLRKDYPEVSDQEWKDWIRDRNKARDAEVHRKRRKEDPEYRAKENARTGAAQRKRRKDPKYRAKENARNAASKRKRMDDPELRIKDNARNAASRRKRREDPEYRVKDNANKAASQRKRYQNDLEFRVKDQLRNRLKSVLKRARINKSVPKDRSLVGCDGPFLINWIEKQFKPGWTWGNQGSVWHLDHIKPLSSFNLNSEYDLKMCNRYTNLRPLCAKENMSKGAKIVEASHRPVKV